ncbi:MAG: MarR family transcriptional regulator [Vulcanimicrobiota bacterium]
MSAVDLNSQGDFEELDLDTLEEKFIESIRRIVRAIEMHSQNLIARAGLTSPQLSVLKAIPKLQPATPTSLARFLSLSQSTVSGVLDRLNGKKLIKRQDSTADKRLRSYRLTRSGRLILENAPPLLQENFLRNLRCLHSWERSMLLSALQRTAWLMEADQEEGTPIWQA